MTSCICVLYLSILPLSTVIRFYFGTVMYFVHFTTTKHTIKLLCLTILTKCLGLHYSLSTGVHICPEITTCYVLKYYTWFHIFVLMNVVIQRQETFPPLNRDFTFSFLICIVFMLFSWLFRVLSQVLTYFTIYRYMLFSVPLICVWTMLVFRLAKHK